MDGPPSGAYRIKVTIRFKVRRSERFVEQKGPTKRFRGWVYSKKAGFLSIDFSLNNFSLDRRDYRMCQTHNYPILLHYSINSLHIATFWIVKI